MARAMTAAGKMTCSQVSALSHLETAITIKENGSNTSLTAMEFWRIGMEKPTQVSGKLASNMAMEL